MEHAPKLVELSIDSDTVITLSIDEGDTVDITVLDNDLFADYVDSDNDCVSITLYSNSNMATINRLTYKNTCAQNNNLKKSAGTVAMLKRVLSFIVGKYGDITFTFKDDSKVDCGSEKSSLMYTSLQLHNATWYERHFGAVPSPTEVEQYDTIKRVLTDKTVFKQYDKTSLVKYIKPSVTTFHALFVNAKRIESDNYCEVERTLFTPYIKWLFETYKLSMPYEWQISAATVRSWVLAGGGTRNQKPTTECIKFKGAKRKVYVGKRGGRYVRMNGTFTSIYPF